MFHVSTIKNRFKIRVSDYNKIVEYLNNLCGGLGINIKRPETPSATNPPMVELDRNNLKDAIKELTAPVEPQNPTELSSGYPVGGTAEQKTDTFTASANPNAKGVKVHLLCRGADANDGEHIAFAWRPFIIAADGRVYSIGQEDTPRASVYTDQG